MITTSTRTTKDGYFQPVLKVEQTGQKYTFSDMNDPCLDRKTAQKQADLLKSESFDLGQIVPSMLPIENLGR